MELIAQAGAPVAPQQQPPVAEAPKLSAPSATHGDRINELYRGEIFTEESARIARERVHWMCQQCVGDTALDVGCSQGITAILLAREGVAVTAIDTDPASIQFATAEFANETPQVQGRLRLLETDLASLPETPGFDTVILGEVLEHQALPERFVRQAAARLNPAGSLVITTPFALHPHPDHKISVMPRHIVEIAARLDLQISHLDVLDGYIRCVMHRGSEPEAAIANLPDLLHLTETATLASQRRLFERLDERADQLRRCAEALKVAQKRIAQVTGEAEATAAERAEFVDRLKLQHKRALAELATQRDEEAAKAREAQKASAVASQRADAANRDHALQLAELATQRDAEAAKAREAQKASAVASQRADAADRDHALQLGELAAERNRLTALRKQSVADLEAQAQESHRAQAEALRVSADFEHFKAMAASRHRALNVQIEALRMAHKHDKAKLVRQIASLKKGTATIRSASLYRLGRALILGVKSVRGMVAMPAELTAIARDALARRRARAGDGAADEFEDDGADLGTRAAGATSSLPVPVKLPSAVPVAAPRQPPSPVVRTVKAKSGAPAAHGVALAAAPAAPEIDLAKLVSIYKSGGLPALRLALPTVLTPGSGVNAPSVLLKVGKALSLEGALPAEFELASEALAIDGSAATLRGFFWAAQRSARFDAACDAIRRIEQMYGPNPTEAQRDVLKRLHNSPSYQLTVLELVPTLSVERVDSVQGRVCYMLHNSLPYSSGGYGTRSHGVALGLVAAGYEVIGLTRPGFPADAKPALDGTSIPLEDIVDGLRYLRTLQPSRRWTAPLDYLIAAADKFEQHFRQLRPSLVLAASNYVTALPALIAARRLGLPFIYEVRGLWEITRISREPEYERTPAFAVQRLLESRVMQLADHVFTLTKPMLEELIERGVARERIDLLPNSCNPERFVARPRDESLAQRLGLPQGVPVIGYIGTFVDYEGLDDLALACALLKQRGVAFRLLLVGNENTSTQDRGPITQHIESVATSEGFSDWLIMPGRVPHDEVEAYYSLIDIAPFPRKPLPVCEMVSPMKPLEALAMEKAVVVSSVRALNEMIADGKTGRVFEKGNLVSLADVLHDLVERPAQRADLGRQGREWVSAERTWNQVGQKFRRIVSSVLPGRAEPSGETAASPSSSVVASGQGGAAPQSCPPAERRAKSNDHKPSWWDKIDTSLRDRCGYVDVTQWKLSDAVVALRGEYLARFEAEAVARRIPPANWARADICADTVVSGASLLDVGSGLGEFINLVARQGRHGELTSVDVRDWDLWFDATGRLQRLKCDFFMLDASHARDVVTCFEVIEHLPTERVAEAVHLLRSLARQRLYVSVPFMEGLPMHRGHRTRFDAVNLGELFPDARFIVYGKGNGSEVRAWIMCEIDMTPASLPAPI